MRCSFACIFYNCKGYLGIRCSLRLHNLYNGEYYSRALCLDRYIYILRLLECNICYILHNNWSNCNEGNWYLHILGIFLTFLITRSLKSILLCIFWSLCRLNRYIKSYIFFHFDFRRNIFRILSHIFALLGNIQ